MKRGGAGIGSASILLVFTVLCLAIFAVISYNTARTDKAATDNWEKTVREYYAADLLAEQILAEILDSDTIPAAVRGVELVTEPDGQAGAVVMSYGCPVSEGKELRVRVAVFEDTYDILEWRMQNTGGGELGGGIIILP